MLNLLLHLFKVAIKLYHICLDFSRFFYLNQMKISVEKFIRKKLEILEKK